MEQADRASRPNDDARPVPTPEECRERARAMLHSPGRADQLLTLEEHLMALAGLSRVLWVLTLNLCDNPGLNGMDPRDTAGLHQLADALADHASAAFYIHAYGVER